MYLLAALKKQSDSETEALARPHEAIEYEFYDHRHHGPIMLSSYRAVLALMSNNNLPCFRCVNKEFVSKRILEMETDIKASQR